MADTARDTEMSADASDAWAMPAFHIWDSLVLQRQQVERSLPKVVALTKAQAFSLNWS